MKKKLLVLICVVLSSLMLFSSFSFALTGITLNKTSITVNQGKTVTLKANISVTWSSSDSTIASVSPKGVVTGIRGGKATIKAKSSDGKTSACKVTVPLGPVVNLVFATLGSPQDSEAAVLAAVNKALKADGLNFNIKTVLLDDYWNKLALTVAGGEPLDIAWAHSSTLPDLSAKKVYQPVTDVFNTYAPDLKKNTPDYVIKGGSINGKLYAFPRVIPMAQFGNVYIIRGDLREKYGMAPITSVSQLETFLENVKKNDPDIAGSVDPGMVALYGALANYYFPLGDNGSYPIYVDPRDSTYTVKNFFASEGFAKACATKLSWKNKGYIPSDVASKFPDATGAFLEGKTAVEWANLFSKSEQIGTFAKNVPSGKMEVVKLTNDKYIFSAGDNMLAVPSSSKHLREAVQFINWIKKNQANYDLWSFGVKGVNYNLNGQSVSTEGVAKEKLYNTMSWMWNDIRVARFDSHMTAKDISDLRNWDKDAVKTPFIGFAIDASKMKAQVTNVMAVWNEYFNNLAMGQVDYNGVKAEVLNKLDKAGINDVIDEVQKQLNAYLKK